LLLTKGCQSASVALEKKSKTMEIKVIVFWVLLIAMAGPFLFFGFAKVVGKPDKVELFNRLGYPIWFMKLIGFSELAAAVCLLFPPTRPFSIGLSAIILVGAIVSHIRAKEPKEAMAPTFVFLHLVAIYIFTFFL
jgi:uncharacterized membrane protein YphA (DoxX/SURF4 family)